jgi:ABC-type thiamin/hydroxymethylpyrimidine transport system permease subunit
MASGIIKVAAAVLAIIAGIGLTLFYKQNYPATSTNTLILMGIGVTIAAFVSLYFMTKSSS